MSEPFVRLVEAARTGPHAALIARDVPRAFGAVAPHKRRENGDGSIADSSAAAAEAAAVMRGMGRGGGGGQGDGDEHGGSVGGHEDGGPGGRGKGVHGFGLLTNLLGLMGSDEVLEEAGTPGAQSRGGGKGRRASLSVADFSNDLLAWLPQSVSPRASQPLHGTPPPSRGNNASRPYSLSPPRAPRGMRPTTTSTNVPTADRDRRRTVGVSSHALRAARLERAHLLMKRASFGEGRVTNAQKDAAWLAEAERLWEEVPLVAKRQCLSNVLLAMSARFPDVGYCQVSAAQGCALALRD